MDSPLPAKLPPLTKESAYDALRNFFRDKPFVFFGTGMSCALDTRFGMPALKDELLESVFSDANEAEQGPQWKMAKESLQNGGDLEAALNHVADPRLLQEVTSVTGDAISLIDQEYAWKIANRDVTWPATSFFKRLVDNLPEGDPVLHVLTPNYDTLFEHACDSVGIPYANGFFGGLERQIDWNATNNSLLVGRQVSQRGRKRPTYKQRKHVRLYKVHGSLNLFFHRNKVVENNSWMWNAPGYCNRIIITPGLSKHEMLQSYRQELLRPADEAIEKANQFLFLGYGFNDAHLEAYINQKLIDQGCRGLILTRDSNSRIVSLLAQSKNLWLVCREGQGDVEGTRILNKQYAGPLVLPSISLWDIRIFMKEVLGI